MNPPRLLDTDDLFFRQHPGRKAMIRAAHDREQEGEFMSLGPHDRSRRRIIAWKVPQDCAEQFRRWRGEVIRIPYLTLGDETIENTDAVLISLLTAIMKEAAAGYGMGRPGVV